MFTDAHESRCGGGTRAARAGRVASWAVLLAIASVSGDALAGSVGQFQDPLDTPAQVTRFATQTQLGAIATAGKRLVTVGVRGLIALSDDAGRTWRQVASPVSSDLVSVRFVSARQGWAAGHDGAILATADGGEHWVKQIDGRTTADLLKAHLGALAAGGDARAARLQKGVTLNYQDGPEVPMLDLWFESEQIGWAIGSFGTIIGTRDGGKTWASWMEKVDNDRMHHFNAIADVGGNVYLASEQGALFRLDRTSDRFIRIVTGYNGSFFGVVGTSAYVIAYGIGGSAYRSRDNGATWQRLSTGVQGSITSGCILDDGRLLFASQDGHLIMSRDQGDTFQTIAVSWPDLFTGIAAAGRNQVVLTGVSGVNRATLQ